MINLKNNLDNYAIYFKNVSYHTNGTKIIRNITGVFPRGKITAIVGPSGAGKTTILKLCNHLISPTSGSIFLEEKLINQLHPAALRRTVGLALQEATMMAGSVEQNLSLPYTLQQHKLHHAKSIQLLNSVGLDDRFLSRDVKQLSGGQKQKLSLARTLVNEPRILLLDEITSSLDQISANEIEMLIGRLNKDKAITVIWITHDLDQAKRVSDYVWIVDAGQLSESGPITILDNPTSEAGKQFVGEVTQ